MLVVVMVVSWSLLPNVSPRSSSHVVAPSVCVPSYKLTAVGSGLSLPATVSHHTQVNSSKFSWFSSVLSHRNQPGPLDYLPGRLERDKWKVLGVV